MHTQKSINKTGKKISLLNFLKFPLQIQPYFYFDRLTTRLARDYCDNDDDTSLTDGKFTKKIGIEVQSVYKKLLQQVPISGRLENVLVNLFRELRTASSAEVFFMTTNFFFTNKKKNKNFCSLKIKKVKEK